MGTEKQREKGDIRVTITLYVEKKNENIMVRKYDGNSEIGVHCGV